MAKSKSKLRTSDSNNQLVERCLDDIEILTSKTWLTAAEQAHLSWCRMMVSSPQIEEKTRAIMEGDKTKTYIDAFKEAKALYAC